MTAHITSSITDEINRTSTQNEFVILTSLSAFLHATVPQIFQNHYWVCTTSDVHVGYNISPLAVEIEERIYVYKIVFFNLIGNINKTNIQNIVIF